MNMKYLLACSVAAVSIGTAMADPKPTVFPHGIAGSSNVMTSAGAVQGALSDTVTKAQGSVQQSTANQPNGYAKPDASGNVTLPVTGSVAAAPADASGDTVSTIAATAKSGSALAATAVQKTQIGAANGVAPLDSQTRMSAAVSGDVSAAPVVYSNGSPFELSAGMSDFFNARVFGLKFDGSTSDAAAMDTWYSKVPQGVVWYPAGILWPDTAPCTPWTPSGDHKYLLFRSNGAPGYACDGWNVNLWQKDTTGDMFEQYANGTLEYGRTYGPNTTNSPMMRLVDDNNDPSKKPGEGLSQGQDMLDLIDTMEDGGFGSMHPLYVKMTVKGRNWGQNQHANIETDTFRSGPYATEGMWGLFQAVNETNALGPDTDGAKWAIGDEIDLSGIGSDAAHMRNAYRIGLNAYNPGAWQANKAYNQGDLVTDTALQNVYVVTVAGTSGATEPTWSTATVNSSTTTDGTVTWMLKNPYHFEVSDGFFAGGGGNNYVNYRTVFSTDAQVTHAVFDASLATLTGSSAALRLASGQVIDFSGHGDDDENIRTLGFNPTNGLVYQAGGNITLTAKDNGDVVIGRGITLGSFPTATILGFTGMSSGYIVNDSDINQPVIYEAGKWYPIQLGTALSN